ncbi:MAG: hypothetical protein EXS67_04450 [Candidatus Margulisbacteria bacterium]|nr:hypothetical protein [Candidatus Margulisiibacteriota bacterium]
MKKIIAQTLGEISQRIALLLVENIQVGTLSFSKQCAFMDDIKASLEKNVMETLIRKLASIGADKALYAVLSYAKKNNVPFDINSHSSASKTAYQLASENSHSAAVMALTCFGVSTPEGGEYGHSATSIARYPAILVLYHKLSIIPFNKITLIGPGLLWISRPSGFKEEAGMVCPIKARFFSNSMEKEFVEVINPHKEVLTWADSLPFYFSIFLNADVIVVDRPNLVERVHHSTMLSDSDMYSDMLNLFLHNLRNESSEEVMGSFIAWHTQGAADFPYRTVKVFPKDLYDNLIEFKVDGSGKSPQSFAALPVASHDCNLIVALNVLQYPALRCTYESLNSQYDLDRILLSLFVSMGESGQDVLIVTKDSLVPYQWSFGLLKLLIQNNIVHLEEVPDGSKGKLETLVVIKLNDSHSRQNILSAFNVMYPASKSA